MNDKSVVLKGVLWKFAERFSAQLISFFVSIVLARLLLPDDFGLVALVLVFIVFADVFVYSGFSTSLIQKKDADAKDFSTIFYCSFVVSIIVYGILFVSAPYVAEFYKMPLLTDVLRVFALRVPLGAFNSIQHAYVSRHMIFKRFFFSTSLGTLLSGVIGIAFALLDWGVWALVAQYLSKTIIDSIVLAITVPWRPQLLFSFSAAQKLMNFGWKVLVADFLGTFFDQLRSLIIGKYYMAADLAYYNRGRQLSGLVSDNISSSLMSVLFPALSNYSEDRAKIKQMVRRAVKVMSYIVFPLLGGMIATASSLIDVLLTNKWKECVPFVQILSLAAAIAIVSNVGLQVVKAIGRSDILLKLEFVKKPVYFILLVIGVKISVTAVAITMAIYSLYSTIVNTNILRKEIEYTYVEQILDLLPAFMLSFTTCAMVGMLAFTSLSSIMVLILQVFCAIVLYLIGSYLFRIDSFEYLVQYFRKKRKL